VPATNRHRPRSDNPRNPAEFPQRRVTSNLNPEIQSADHRQGGGGIRRNPGQGLNSLVLKILTSNPQALKILQAIFANPAPVKAFRRVGGGGTPRNQNFFPIRPSQKPREKRRRQGLFHTVFHSRKAASSRRPSGKAHIRRAFRKPNRPC
jgi:hypothetical protein